MDVLENDIFFRTVAFVRYFPLPSFKENVTVGAKCSILYMQLGKVN